MSKRKINITAMSSDDTKLLFKFLLAQKAVSPLWKANQVYDFCGDQITFSHDIVWRKRKMDKETKAIKPGHRFDVISTNKLGHGAFGTVYDVTGTLALDADNIALKQSKIRVVKIQNHSLNNPATHLKNEYKMAQRAPHIGVKHPTLVGDTSYTVMKKLPGRELWDIIKDDLYGKRVLSLEQRQQISIAVLKAYKEQVLDKGVIHRDVKPPNIMVDLSNPIAVNFIDYGLSTLVNPSNAIMCGTPGFIAPEIYNGATATSKVDIFSLGRVLGLLWRDKTSHYAFPRQVDAQNFANNVHYNDLFIGLDTLNVQNKNIIKSTLTNMTKQNLAARIDIDEAINAFEGIQLLNNIPSTPKNPKPVSAKNIQLQIDNIIEHLEALRLKNQDLRKRGFKELGREYSQLADQIETKIKEFQNMKPDARKKNIITWIDECQNLIDPVKTKMGNNRDANYILANLGLAIAGLGLFYLIAIACNKASSGNWLFFSKPKSVVLAENLEEGLQQVAAAVA